ncbi:MAG TPA: Gfo/Idh/MocA family oxidoreductase [Anaerohalosphaeraceae bacterium]|jgi:predicted dehydrogenase|nr:Gfo/Idh/MocA family oxidoreductase [Anaerohalosphaeraceae bacterium]
MKKSGSFTRRRFLKEAGTVAAGLAGFPYLIRSSALGLGGAVAPSNRITVGCVGMGWQGGSNLGAFLAESDAQVTAVCDIDTNHLNAAKNRVNGHYRNTACKSYTDFRELMADSSIDAVMLALPDHWHGIIAAAAARAGKDIYGEKPLTHTLREGRILCGTVNRYGIIWQTGSWQRSESNFRFACQLVRNGRIGRVHTIEVGLPAGHSDFGNTRGQETMGPPPAELDYETWLGPAPWAPYCPARVHKNWRWIYDYGGGQLMDWVGHHVDIAHWGLDLDRSGPVEMEGTAQFPADGLWNTATKYKLHAKYAEGYSMIIAGGYDDIRDGTKWIGTDGWVWVTRGRIDAWPKSLLQETFGPGQVYLPRAANHVRNFLDCVKNRKETLTPCETAHRSASAGHVGLVALRLGRKVRFDPKTEQILNDPVANEMLGHSFRGPWTM